MDWKRNYHKLLQCKKPHEKRRIRREIASFYIVSKMAIFGKTANWGTIGKFSKMDDFLGKLRKAAKWEIQVAQYPN